MAKDGDNPTAKDFERVTEGLEPALGPRGTEFIGSLVSRLGSENPLEPCDLAAAAALGQVLGVFTRKRTEELLLIARIAASVAESAYEE